MSRAIPIFNCPGVTQKMKVLEKCFLHTYTFLFGNQYDLMYQKNVSKLKELNFANVMSNFYSQLSRCNVEK